MRRAAIVVYYFLLNSGYKYWWGGSIFGLRHLSPALAFLCLFLGPVFDVANRQVKALLGLAGAYGAFVCFLGVATSPNGVNEFVFDPLWKQLWPAFRRGQLAFNCNAFTTDVHTMLLSPCTRNRSVAWNFGQEAPSGCTVL
jgi:hypothetical protein